MNPENRSDVSLGAIMRGNYIPLGIAAAGLIFAAFAPSFVPAQIILLVALIAAIVTVILGIYFIQNAQKRVGEQLKGLSEVCRDFASGERSVRAVVSGNDELSDLARSLNALLDNQNNVASASLSGGGDAAALQAQIEKLLQEVSAVGDGDLRVQAEVTPDTLGVLADSFNYMIEELAKVVGRVQSTAVQVTNATRRILDRSAELAQASETQVKQIAQTTEAVEALAGFIQNVARNAQLSVEAAQEALRNAATGQQAVRQTIEGMMLIRENVQETAKKIKRLGERSNEIGEIVRIIEDIADQTNLLALNAAIQSAMAGEHGRGFAVVADEIRLLAERSTESTKRIATLVKSIQGDTYEAVVAMEDSTQEVVKGSQLADDAGRSLNSIYTAVERQAQMIETIARAANEQTSVSEAVAVAMSRISEITRQTDAGTQEAAVSVSYLAELSEQLRASVSTFRLPERASEMLGSFGGAGVSSPSLSEPSSEMGNPSFGSGFGASLNAPVGEPSWGQDFGGNFPPLPEPGNTGSLVPVSSPRAGQFAPMNNVQQDFSQPGNNSLSGIPSFGSGLSQPGISDIPSFSGQQPSFGGQNPSFNGQQPSFGGQNPSFGGQQSSFSGQQPSFGGQQQFFGGDQQDFNFGGFDDVQSSNGGFGNFQFGSGMDMSGQGNMGNSNPSLYPQQSNSGVPSQSIPGTHSGGLLSSPYSQQSGQPAQQRPRWQNLPPKDVNQ